MNDNILTGVYEKRIKSADFEKISKIFSLIKEDEPKKVLDKMIIEIDRFRNMLFLEGILQNNQCFISAAYDLDRFITENSFNALQEVKEIIDEIIQSKDNTCKGFHTQADYNIFEKMKWNKHFRTATNNFKDLNGWNSLKIKENNKNDFIK